MEAWTLYGIHVLIYSSIPLYIGTLKPIDRTIAFYILIATVLFLGGFIGQVYSLSLGGDLIISGGNWAYAALMLFTFLAVISSNDIRIVRNIIRIVVIVNIAKILFFHLVSRALLFEGAVNPFATSPELFSLSTWLVALGGFLIITELIIILTLLEGLKKSAISPALQRACYPFIFTAIVCFDGVVYPLIAQGLSSELSSIVIGNLQGKFVTALGFSCTMSIYLWLYSNTTRSFFETPLNLGDLFTFGNNKALEERLKAQGEVLKLSEGQLRDVAERLTLATRSAGIGIWEIDPKNLRVIWDERTYEIHGVDRSIEMNLNRWLSLVNREDQLMLVTIIGKDLEPGETVNKNFRIMRKNDGRLVHLEVQASRVATANGQRILGVCRDVTSQTELQQANESLQKQLFQTQRMDSIGQFAGGIAHDFNNLLIPIMGFAELSLEQLGRDSEHGNNLAAIIKAAERAKVLIRQLMAFGRQQVFETHVQDLNTILMELEDLLSRLAGDAIVLNLTYFQGGAFIQADRGQIEQIIMNLAANAKDAMDNQGEISIAVNSVVSEKTGEARVTLTVSDNGSGMTDEILEKIFEPFFSTKTGVGGTGLGLAMVKGIIEQHDADIWVDSQVGVGSTFVISFPAVSPPTMMELNDDSLESQQGNETILVVEDDESVRGLVEQSLRRQGYNVLLVGSATELLESNLGGLNKVDLLLTDVVMPDLSGPDLYQALKDKGVTVKVLYMSGYTAGILPDGNVLFLEKPFSAADLHQMVRRALEQ